MTCSAVTEQVDHPNLSVFRKDTPERRAPNRLGGLIQTVGVIPFDPASPEVGMTGGPAAARLPERLAAAPATVSEPGPLAGGTRRPDPGRPAPSGGGYSWTYGRELRRPACAAGPHGGRLRPPPR